MGQRMVSRQNTGFTIVEMLFVLAIAGIVLLLIFQVIPVLNRNAQNGQRNQDVERILQAVTKYEANNSGDFPKTCGDPGNFPSTGYCNDSGTFLQYTKLSYFDAHDQVRVYANPDVGHVPITVGSLPSVSGSTAEDIILIYNYHRCKDTPADVTDTAKELATADGAGYFDTVAITIVATAQGSMLQCRQA